MKITYLVLGPFMTNTYIIYDENTMDAVIIDPSFTPENIIRAVAQLKVNVKGIFLTHGHVDHMAGLNKLKGVYKEARVYMIKSIYRILKRIFLIHSLSQRFVKQQIIG